MFVTELVLLGVVVAKYLRIQMQCVRADVGSSMRVRHVVPSQRSTSYTATCRECRIWRSGGAREFVDDDRSEHANPREETRCSSDNLFIRLPCVSTSGK